MTGGLWREGDALVVHRNAALPAICVRSGAPASTRISRTLTWYPRWVLATALLAFAGIGLLPFIVCVVIFTKKATIAIPLAEPARKRRRNQLAAAWLGGVAGIGAIVVGVALSLHTRDLALPSLALAIAGVVALFVAIAIGQRVATIVRVRAMSDHHVWIEGLHPSLVEGLPDWTVRRADAPTWEWSLDGGERVTARLDLEGTESVWLGARLVSRVARGAKPDGHVIPLAGGAYRGNGVARVTFDPAMPACALDLDGAAVAPSPFPAPTGMRPGKGGRTIASLVVATSVVALLALALVGVKMRMETRGAPMSSSLTLEYTSRDGDVVVHYPSELAAEPLGESGVALEQTGALGSSVSIESTARPVSNDPNEIMRVTLDAIVARGVSVAETSRTTEVCHGETAVVVEARLHGNQPGKLHVCTFVLRGRAYVLSYSYADTRPADAPILRRIVDESEIKSLTSPSEPIASAAASAPLPSSGDVLAECKGEETVCSTDAKKLVQCHAGKAMMVIRECLGPRGCTGGATAPRCDETIARAGDLCSPQGRIACSEDGKWELTCTSNKPDETPAATATARPLPTYRYRGWKPPPPPPAPPVVVRSDLVPGTLVYGKPRLCKSACNVVDGTVRCD